MEKRIWKKGWFLGVLGCVLIATVPPLVLALVGVDRSGTTRDEKGGVRMWSFGFFSASNVYIDKRSAPADQKAPNPTRKEQADEPNQD